MGSDLWVALALLLVVEGLMPAMSPRLFRQLLASMAQMDDRSIRTSGLVSMVLGAVLVYLLKH